jgi:hypothetical protein
MNHKREWENVKGVRFSPLLLPSLNFFHRIAGGVPDHNSFHWIWTLR